jgi:predicted NACHT family NTPase
VFKQKGISINYQNLVKFVTFTEKTTGLLVRQSERYFGFIHLTFEEYLAACYFARYENIENMFNEEILGKRRLYDLRWHEVIKLLAAKLADKSEEMATEFISLIYNPDKKYKWHKRLISALACLSEDININEEFKLKILGKTILVLSETFKMKD